MPKFQNEFVDVNIQRKWLQNVLTASFFNIWFNLLYIRLLVVIARAEIFEAITLIAISAMVWNLTITFYFALSEVNRESLKSLMQQREDFRLILAIFAVALSLIFSAFTFFALFDSYKISYVKVIDGGLSGCTFVFIISLICINRKRK